METVCVVWMGFNQMKSYFGVFEDEATAMQALLDAGCRYISASESPCHMCKGTGESRHWYEDEDVPLRTCPRCRGKGKHGYPAKYVPTKKFLEWLQANCTDTPVMYSVGPDLIGEQIGFSFDTVKFDCIVRGYDDD